MECLDFRRLCDSDPNSGEPEFAAHAEQCTACARELERARRFDARLLAALRIDVPEASRDGLARAEAAPAGASPSAASAADAAPSESWRADASAAGRGLPLRVKRLGLGLAASLIVAAGVGTAVRLTPSPTPALAAAVLEHIRDEPEALREGRSVLDAAAVQRELAQHGVRLSEQIGAISYVRICPFEGRQVPHLVVQTPTGPVTVMLLLDEHASGSIVIDKGAFSGRIVPAGNGSIAIVGIGHPVDAAEQSRIVAAVAWEA